MRRRYFWYGFLAVCGFAIAAESEAAETGYFKLGGTGNYASLSAAQAVHRATYQAGSCDYLGPDTAVTRELTYTGNGSTVHTWWHVVECQNNTNYNTSSGIEYVFTAPECDDPAETFNTTTGQCEDPPECPLAVGEKVIKSGNGTAPSTRCDGNCSYTKSGAGITMSGGYMAWYEVDGVCGTETGDGAQDNQNCLQTAGGTTYCMDNSKPDENCGTVNGEYVCLDGVPDGNCVFTPNGQAICDGGSQTNTPDETISTDTDTLDIFGNGNTGGTSGGGGNTSGTDDVGGTPGGGSGTGDGSQPGDCDGTNCQGQLPGANEAVDDFGTLFANFYGRVQGAPVIAAFGGIPGSLPAGSCAAVDSDPIAFLNNQVLSLDVHCSMWQDIEPIISGVMLAIWALLGGLIILRA